jgi:urea transporter
MQVTSGRWKSMTEASAFLKFVDINLRGAGQVMFQNNPLTGLIFLLGIAWGAFASGTVVVAVGAVVGLVVATVAAIAFKVDAVPLRSGLFGYNGILVGAALPTFLQVNATMWCVLIFAAAASVVVMLAIANVVKTWSVSALTAPFVLTTWLFLLASYALAGLPESGLPHPGLPQPMAAGIGLDVDAMIGASLRGISQVFLIGNAVTGCLFILALAVNSAWAAIAALAGSAIAVVVAWATGASPQVIAAGLFGFSPVLTAVAVATVFYSPGPRVVGYAIGGAVFTVFAQAALDVALRPLGIPTLTAPFVLATWVFLLPRRSFAPVPHEVGQGGVLHPK